MFLVYLYILGSIELIARKLFVLLYEIPSKIKIYFS